LGKLADDQIEVAEGKCEQLSGKIQESYGLAQMHAQGMN
jgi:uncharacterized protein YjbJ (UPF0337 family)